MKLFKLFKSLFRLILSVCVCVFFKFYSGYFHVHYDMSIFVYYCLLSIWAHSSGCSLRGPLTCATSIHRSPPSWLAPPRGRPRQSWLRTIESDLKPLNLGLHSALRRATDRPSWRRIVEMAMLFERVTWWWRWLPIISCSIGVVQLSLSPACPVHWLFIAWFYVTFYERINDDDDDLCDLLCCPEGCGEAAVTVLSAIRAQQMLKPYTLASSTRLVCPEDWSAVRAVYVWTCALLTGRPASQPKNQALSVLSLSLGFLWLCVVLLTRDSF